MSQLYTSLFGKEWEHGNNKKKLGQASSAVEFPLSNVGKFTWTGKLFMGPDFELVDVIFDTASDWLVI